MVHEVFEEYLENEIRTMLVEIGKNCPVDSQEFNETAIDWIEKNGAKFRDKWNKQHSINEYTDLH